MYQLIIFDWDGTIMDSAQKIANCIQASARDAGLKPPSTAQAKSIIGLGLTEAMARLFPEAGIAQIKRLIDGYKYHFVTGDVTEQKLFEGVEAGLTELEKTGALLAVATGKSRAGLDRAFEATGLGSRFVTTRCADETRSKPHPQMLHEILDFTAMESKNAIMVGDTSFDMQMARNANMPGLGVSYGVHAEHELIACDALTVQPSFNQLINWLLDGRTREAYA